MFSQSMPTPWLNDNAQTQVITAETALEQPQVMLMLLQQWVDKGWLRALDLACARFLLDQVQEMDALVLLTAALASHQTGRGHVCLDLAQCLQQPNFVLSMPPEDLPELAEAVLTPDELLKQVGLMQWQTTLQQNSQLVDSAGTDHSDQAPLVLFLKSERIGALTDQQTNTVTRPLLYLRRYWQYEQEILGHLDRLLANQIIFAEEDSKRALNGLFKPSLGNAPLVFTGEDSALTGEDGSLIAETNWQKVACALAAKSAFAIITGGPGTGKTTTVINLLALLQFIELKQSIKLKQPIQGLQIALAAPTGKAAARLNESLSGKIAELDLKGLNDDDSSDIAEKVRANIPTEVTTLHRLLGARPDSRHFRHHKHNPLTADIVVVDEASMIDVEMMSRLMDALKPKARLILLGDKDQLASVEAGSVLGSLCERADRGHYQPETLQWLRRVTDEEISDQFMDAQGQPLDQAVAMLRKSHRFSDDSGIKHLADAVNRCQSQQALNTLKSGQTDIGQLVIQDQQDNSFERLVREGYAPYLEMVNKSPLSFSVEPHAQDLSKASSGTDQQGNPKQHPLLAPGQDLQRQAALDQWADQVIKQYAQFQLLTALRRGEWGIEGLNIRIREILRRKLKGEGQIWYPGRPVLVTSNDYSLKLMNGDIGITLQVPVKQNDGSFKLMLRVAFPMGDGTNRIRWILPSRLQAVETVFAMTVHKSQGSEFNHTVLVLPEHNSPVLSKELIYTGITRAKDKFTLVYKNSGVLRQGIEQRILRANGM